MTAPALRDRVIALVEPLIEQLGFELVDLECAAGQGAGKLAIYIDLAPARRAAGVTEAAEVTVGDPAADYRESGIGVEDCERVSREVSALLDVEDPMPGAYTLEVSSPGFDRVLAKPEHFRRFIGSRVKVELALARDGRRRYTGQLVAADDKSFGLEVDGEDVSIAYAELGRARIAP